MAHVEIIENHRSTLLRCINLNVLIVAGLREEGVIDDAIESRLEAVKAHHDKLCLLIDCIKNSPERAYESFLQVMEENEQQHVANLLRGNVDGNHIPLSLAKHSRLLKIRRTLMRMIHNNVDLIAALSSSSAISQTDVDDLSVGNVPIYKRNFHLINAILRRSEYAIESFHDALRDTHQPDAADYLTQGEVIQVHANTTRPDLDEDISESINNALVNESMDETTVKEIQIPHMNGLRIVGATPGNSIVIFVYCKTIDNMVTFTQLFNSGELQTKLEDFLNRLFVRIEPKSSEKLGARIRLDDEEVLEIEEITGIEDWLKIENAKSTQSGHLLTSHKLTEAEQPLKEVVSTVSHTTDEKQQRRSFFDNFESLLSEEEDLLILFHSKKATTEQDYVNWKRRKNMLNERLGKLLEYQTSIYKILLSWAESYKDVHVGQLRPSAQNLDSRLKQQQQLWKSLKEEILDESKELKPSSSQPAYASFGFDRIDSLLQEVRFLKCKLKTTRETHGKGIFFLALENLKVEGKGFDGSETKPPPIDTRGRERYQIDSTHRPHKLAYMSRHFKSERAEKNFLSMHRYERSREKQLESIKYFGLEMSHADVIQKNYNVLLRCTTINFYVIDSLRAKDVLDDAQESDLKAERSHIRQLMLLFQWLKVVPPHRYQSFLEVMKDTDQKHVANLLTGSTEEDHLPLSDVRYTLLAKLRPKLAEYMDAVYSNLEVIQQLLCLGAISSIVADEIKAEKVPYTTNSKLISAIMRGSNHSYNSLKEAFRKTNQKFVADTISEGEILTVHDKIRARDDMDIMEEILEKLSGSTVSPAAANPGKKEPQLLQYSLDSAVK